VEEDLIGAMSCTHELKWNEIFKFACSGPCPLVAALCRLGERPLLAAVSHEDVNRRRCAALPKIANGPVRSSCRRRNVHPRYRCACRPVPSQDALSRM